MTTRVHAGRIRPLPIDVRPRAGESVDSYIRRLARANHLRPSYLHGYLAGPPHYLGAIQPERLAALAGRPLPTLAQALPALRPADDHTRRDREGHRAKHTPRTVEPVKADKLRLFAAIRGEADQGQSIRTLAARYRVHRRTIRQALTSATPPPRKAPTRGSPVLNHVRNLIDALMNQGLTARQIWERLLDDHDATISYSTVVTYLAQRRKDPPT